MDETRLNQMRSYALDHGCLRNHLLRYFGEQRYERCGNCSSCLGLSEDDAEVKLKKALRAKRNEDVADPALFEALRQLRLAVAREQQLKPFMVFSDATLRNMCEVRPTTMEEFLTVSGVGETKAKRYGDAFLACIRECGG